MRTPATPRPLRAALRLVSLTSWLVPEHRRDGFREEWRTELICSWEILVARGQAPSALGFMGHAAGCVRDAMWLLVNEWRWDMLSSDLRYALRSLTKQPGFTVAVIATLALSIGATTAVFSVVDDVLLTPLPYDEPTQLTMVWESFAERGRYHNPVSPANFLAWRERVSGFDDLAAISGSPMALTGLDDPIEVSALRVSTSLFPILRVSAMMGRVFTEEEEVPDRAKVCLLTHGFWKSRLGGSPDILGQTLSLAGVEHEVVGVLPPGFDGNGLSFMQMGGEPQIFLPLAFPPEAREFSGRYLSVLGRLRDGSGIEAAGDEMARISSQLAADFPDRNSGWSTNVVPLHEHQVGDARLGLLVSFAAVSLVLLIACVNIANLTLARALARRRDVAIRTSLGAGAGRIARQLLTESSLLALVGGGIGILLAVIGTPLLVAALPESVSLPRRSEIDVDGAALVFGVLVSALCGLGFGVVPAWGARRLDLSESLREGGDRGASGTSRKFRWLVVAQSALALVLLTGAGLLMRSLFLVHQVDPGVRPNGVLTARIILPGSRYDDARSRAQFFDSYLERLRASPGVQEAAAIQWLPLTGVGSATSFYRADQPTPPPDEKPVTNVRVVSSSYFRTLAIPLMQGRDLDERDIEDAPPVLVVNAAMAKQYFPGVDPIGKQLVVSWTDDTPITIIGIVGDVLHQGLEAEPRPTVYLPYHQVDQGFLHIVVRSQSDPYVLAPVLKEAARAVDPEQPVASIRSLDDVASRSVATRRFQAVLLSVFAAAAVLLAGLGIYGVSAYAVNRRRREMGLRLALGASAKDVRRLVVLSSVKLVAIGTAIGLGASLALSRWLETMLFRVEPADPATLLSVSVVLLSVAVLGSYWPAERATRADPLETLRCD